MSHFYIDLKGVRRPEVSEFYDDNLAELCQAANVTDPMDLDDFDSRVFNSEARADAWLARYRRELSLMPRLRDKPAGVKCMLLKRHYLPQVAMGDKMYTCRTYDKGWPAGTLIAFHDQVHCVYVHLTRITDTDDGFRYDYVRA